MYVEWTPKLEVGVPEIDDQHKSIFNQLNSLMAAMRAGKGKQEIATVLDFLANYVQEHFADEEKEMERSRYPHLAAHRANHLTFIDTYLGLKQKFSQEGPTTPVVMSIQREMVDWVINHIRDVDRKFADYLRESGAQK